jgi:hypothetical protein
VSTTEAHGSQSRPVPDERGPDDQCAADCRVDIRIESQGNVNIYNCAGGQQGQGPCPPDAGPPAETSTAPVAPGQCVPLAIGSKPKQSQRSKLDTLLQDCPVPNVIASAFFQHSRRFLAGKAPANPLEAQAFALFESLSPDVRAILSCSVISRDAIAVHEQSRLFHPAIPQDPSTPLDAETIATAFAEEVKQRVGLQVFGNAAALDGETPGQNRFFDTTGIESFESQLRVCTINGLRTNEYSPAVSPGDRLPTELQQHCEPVLVDGVVQPNCEVLNGNCPGNALDDGTCLRVPDVRNGDGVVLEGVNFISIDSTVRLTATPPGTMTVDVDAFVVGDSDTPLTELVDGESLIIRDCRVHDRITFAVPADLAPGTYSVQVVVPNVSGFPGLGDPIVSNSQFIQVVPPVTARFRISSETLTARQETSPASFGSDEVRVVVTATPYTIPLTEFLRAGEPQLYSSGEFGDMDSGVTRPMEVVLFDQKEPMDAVTLLILGYEIDSETAYEKQITSFVDAFLYYLKYVLVAIAVPAGIGAVWMGLLPFLKLALAHPILLAIVAAAALAVTIVLAAWAPADTIISDLVAFTTTELAALTSLGSPMPVLSEYLSQDGIKVKVTPLAKIPTQYRERREYISAKEESRYEIVLRYNLVA